MTSEDPAARLALGLIGAATYFDQRRAVWYGVNGELLATIPAPNPDGTSGVMWGVGPHVGWFMFGADLSYVGQHHDGETRHGVGLRARITLAVASAYVRVPTFIGSDGVEPFLEVGVQVRWLFDAVWPRSRAAP